ncbi:MFS transporter [Robbsia sp. KACC 23696]|uniref:MFS transporter n=1 Tax=Robbsia sp. KACC 23696 TaxID=3149231 RepID=UPI00325BC390
MRAPTTHLPGFSTPTTDADGVYRKVAFKVLPLLIVCYLFAYLDRVNVGFAKLQMLQDLKLSDAAYGFGAGIFFIGYLIFEVPSNVLMMRIGAKKTICRIMILWGLISMAMAFVQTPTQFYVVRFLLGLAEAGFYPGIVLYLTFWFPSYRRSRMLAIFYMAVPLSGIIGGPVSGFLLQFAGGQGGLAGWQWLFLIEGLPSVLLGIAVPFLLCNSPKEAHWLSDDEKKCILDDLAENEREKAALASKHPGVMGVIRDARVWKMSLLCLCQAMLIYGLSFWLPSLVQQLGVKGSFDIGLISAIPLLFAMVVMQINCRSSDKRKERRWHLIVPFITAAVFLSLSTVLRNPVIAMGALTLGVISSYCVTTIMWSLPSLFLSGVGMAAGIGMINALGGLGGFISPWVIGVAKDVTHSTAGGLYFVALVCLVGAWLTYRLPAHEVNR